MAAAESDRSRMNHRARDLVTVGEKIVRRTQWCKHYRAMTDHDTCAAGVPYQQFKDVPFDHRPCFRKKGEETRCGCDLVQFPTPEEEEAREREFKERMAKTILARAAIIESLGGPWKKGMEGSSGAIDCPVCGKAGGLLFSRSGYNGHIHARCQTEECVCWME